MTTAYFASFVALGLTVGSLGPTIPSLAAQTNIGLSAISYVFTFRSLGYVLGSVRGGQVFDQRPGNPVMATMLVAMALLMAVVPLASDLWLLLALMLVLGAAEAALDVGANTLLLRVHGSTVGPFMNAMHSFFGIGALVAPIVVAQTGLFNHPASRSYFVFALLILPLAAYTFRLPSPVAPVAQKQDGNSATNSRLMFLIALFLFLYVGAEVGFAGWIFTYAVEFRLGEATTAAYLTSLFWGSLTLGRVLTIPLVAHIRPRSILVSSLLGCLFSLGLMLFIPRSFGAVLIGTLCLGLSMASIFPTTLTFAGRRMKMSGRMTGWLVLSSSAGSMLIPFLIGQGFQAHPRILMVVVTSTLLAALGVLVLMSRDSQKVAVNSKQPAAMIPVCITLKLDQ